MGEILGLGLSHFGGFMFPDEDMASRVRARLFAADRARHAELAAGNYAPWRELSVETLRKSGQHELLNWYPLAGAMQALGQKPTYCELLESHLMNSSKCVAVIPPLQ